MWLVLESMNGLCVICEKKMLNICSWMQMRNEKCECIEHLVECMVGRNQNTCSCCSRAPVLELRYDRPASGLGCSTWLEWTRVVGISWYDHLSCFAMAGKVCMRREVLENWRETFCFSCAILYCVWALIGLLIFARILLAWKPCVIILVTNCYVFTSKSFEIIFTWVLLLLNLCDIHWAV